MTEQPENDPCRKSLEVTREMAMACIPAAFTYTVSIFHEIERKGHLKAENFGSGVLAKIQGKPFLLTAGHVLDDVLQYTEVALSGLEPGSKGVRLLYEAYATNWPPGTERPDDEDFVDIAAFRLCEEIAKALSERFMPEELFELNDAELIGNQYLIYGFPANIRRGKFFNRTARAKAYPYLTSLYRLERGEPKDYDRTAEVLVDYSRKETLSEDFHLQTAPHPQGMSGCGIWRMYSADHQGESWDGSAMRLVGLSHTYCEKLKVIRGTRISLFNEMIREHLL